MLLTDLPAPLRAAACRPAARICSAGPDRTRPRRPTSFTRHGPVPLDVTWSTNYICWDADDSFRFYQAGLFEAIHKFHSRDGADQSQGASVGRYVTEQTELRVLV